MSEVWADLTNGSFRGIPFHSAIPSRKTQYGVESEEHTIERRLQFIKRPLVDGAAIRDWGQEAGIHTAVIEFFGPNHKKDSDAFFAALDKGTPGTLILPTIPKAVQAYFWKRGKSTRYQEGNALKVSVTWAETSEINAAASSGSSSAFTLTPPSIDQAAAALGASTDNALSILQDNPLLSAIRTGESTISSVRSVVNAVQTLGQGVVSRIATIEAEITGTIAQINSVVASIQSIFSPSASSSRGVPSAASLGTDSETGQQIIDVSEPDSLPQAPDPLAPPAIIPTLNIPTKNVDAIPGVQAFAAAVVAQLTTNQTDINTASIGRTEDVSAALTDVLNKFNDYITAVVGAPPETFTTLTDMSLGEVLFLNGIDQGELDSVYRLNPLISDPFFVPKGTVVIL